MKFNKNKLILFLPLFIAAVAVLYLVLKKSAPEETIVTGMVEMTTVDVASKIPGRLDTVFAKEGDWVVKGQILGLLESKEMDAKVNQAKSLVNAAKSKSDMARNGARPQEIEATYNLYMQANHQFELANKTYNRIQSLYKDRVVSSQEKDQVEFQFKAAKEQMEAAKAKYEMVKQGARYEEKEGANAIYSQARGGLEEALAYSKDLVIKSPITGQLSKRITDPGEIIGTGYPVFQVTDINDNWVVLQLREDLLTKIKMGQVVSGTMPAFGNRSFRFNVTYISVLADYATWKPTNQKGDFDLKTFEIRLRPAEKIEGLRAGMTVNIKL